MNARDYLKRLRRQLRGFSTQEQADLFDEIASHIESGLEDPAMKGMDIMTEMGAPEQMGRGFRNIYNPNRLVDWLLVVVPYLLISPLIQGLATIVYGPLPDWTKWEQVDPHMIIRQWVPFLLAALLAWIGLRRKSAPLALFWLTGSCLNFLVYFNLFSYSRNLIPGIGIGNRFLYAALLILLCLVIFRLLKHFQFDHLLVVFTLIPILMLSAQIFGNWNIWTSSLPVLRTDLTGNLTGSLLFKSVWLLGLSLFFLFPHREIRWLGLIMIWPVSIYSFLADFAYISILAPMFWSFTLALILLAWGMDWRARMNFRLRPVVE